MGLSHPLSPPCLWNVQIPQRRGRGLFPRGFSAVSQKVHRGAVARWRNYPAAIERVSDTLARFVTAFGYD